MPAETMKGMKETGDSMAAPIVIPVYPSNIPQGGVERKRGRPKKIKPEDSNNNSSEQKNEDFKVPNPPQTPQEPEIKANEQNEKVEAEAVNNADTTQKAPEESIVNPEEKISQPTETIEKAE